MFETLNGTLNGTLEQTLGRFQSTNLHLVEHKPARDPVAAHDILRVDQLGRGYVAVPAGQAPASWVELTKDERAALIEAPTPPPDGTMEPGHGGLPPRNISVAATSLSNWSLEP